MRFFDRKRRDKILSNRRSFQKTVPLSVVGEDLTYTNCQVSEKAMEHSATLAVWISNGTILVKVNNGRTDRLSVHMDLHMAFKRSMYSNETNANEDDS